MFVLFYVWIFLIFLVYTRKFNGILHYEVSLVVYYLYYIYWRLENIVTSSKFNDPGTCAWQYFDDVMHFLTLFWWRHIILKSPIPRRICHQRATHTYLIVPHYLNPSTDSAALHKYDFEHTYNIYINNLIHIVPKSISMYNRLWQANNLHHIVF